MIEVLRTATLLAGLVATALFAGLFYSFSIAVMPGLRRADDRTFVSAMQEINVAILNPWFALSFGGAPVLTLLASALQIPVVERGVLPWVAAGAVLCLATVAITVVVNVPLNNALAEAGTPDDHDALALVRKRFEARWVRWNVARTFTSAAAVGCLGWALVVA